jgi:mono/diheme cytochrome c family protein
MLHQPNFRDPAWQRNVTDEELSKVIKWGREPMPFWVGALSDSQIAAVVRFIRSLSSAGVDKDRRSPVTIAPHIGEEASQNQTDSRATTSNADNCVACHKKLDEKILNLYSQSAHAKAGKSCNSCHGGDASATAKEDAHSLNFTGKPKSDQAVRMCGTCHRSEAVQYRASHHFPTQKNVSRVDCVECHGAHTVGAPARGFSVAYFCSGCHGLEYLPGLQQQFQDMLKLSDDLRIALQDMTESGRAPSEDILKRRKEIQRLTGEIVHKTDLEGGTAEIPHILELGDALKAAIRGTSAK